MSLTPEQKRQVARDFGLVNVDQIWIASAQARLPFWIACALIQMESGGRNSYGRDAGGALAGFPGLVNRRNYEVFRWMVFSEGSPSNGVGPTQITSKGYFMVMEAAGLRPWNISDNMFFGFGLLRDLISDKNGDLAAAGAAYNGGPTPNANARAYGEKFETIALQWKSRIQK